MNDMNENNQDDKTVLLENESTSTPENPVLMPPKKSNLLLWILGLGSVSIVLALFIVTIFFPSLLGGISLSNLSPKEYYMKLEEKNAKLISNGVGNYCKKLTNGSSDNMALEASMKLTVDSSIAQQYLSLNELAPLELKMYLAAKGYEKAKIEYQLLYNDQSVISINGLYDFLHNGTMYVKIPELSQDFFSYENMMDIFNTSNTSLSESEISEFFSSEFNNKILEEYNNISADSITRFLDDIFDTLLDSAENVTLDKDGTLTIDDVSVSCNTVVVRYNKQEMLTIAKDILNQIKTDETLISILEQSKDFDKEQFEADIDKEIESIEQEEKSLSDTDKEIECLAITLWTDDSGNVLGRDYTFTTEEGKISIGYQYAKKDTKSAYTAYLKALDGDLIINGTSEENNGKTTGTAVFDVISLNDSDSSFRANIDYKDVSSFLKDGMQGNFILSSPSIPGQLEVTFEEKDGASVITFDISVLGSKAVSIEFSGKEVAYEDFSVPPEGNIHTDKDKFLETFDYNSFSEHLKQTLGDEIYTLIEDSAFGTGEQDDDYDYEEDDDYGYEEEDDDYDYEEDYDEKQDGFSPL